MACLPSVGWPALDEPQFFERGDHPRHRGRLDAFLRGELTRGQRTAFVQGGQRGDLREREVVTDALCPEPAVEPDHRETQAARQGALVRIAGHIVSIPYESSVDRVISDKRQPRGPPRVSSGGNTSSG